MRALVFSVPLSVIREIFCHHQTLFLRTNLSVRLPYVCKRQGMKSNSLLGEFVPGKTCALLSTVNHKILRTAVSERKLNICVASRRSLLFAFPACIVIYEKHCDVRFYCLLGNSMFSEIPWSVKVCGRVYNPSCICLGHRSGLQQRTSTPSRGGRWS